MAQKQSDDLILKSLGKKAYRTLAMQNHPDRGGCPERMKAINQAWEHYRSLVVA